MAPKTLELLDLLLHENDFCGNLRKMAAARDADESRTTLTNLARGLPLMAQKLSEKSVKAIAPPAVGAVTVWDSEIKGFGVRVFAPTKRHPQGARSFFINYRVAARERRFTIGNAPQWTVEAAKNEAKELRRRIDRGEDPADERRQRREAPTVADLAQRYRVEHLPKKAASSQKADWAMIEKDILPRLGTRKVAEIHAGDMQALHRSVSESGRLVRANRVLACASKMFSLSLKPMEGETKPWRDHAQGNPCKGVEKNHEEAKERFFSEAELAALSDALAAYGPLPAGDCIRFLMLTGARPGEAMAAKWEQFDAEPGFWIKPSANTKQRRVHKAPLGPAAIELIERLRAERYASPRTKDSPYVFPGQVRGEPVRHLHYAWREIADAATVNLFADSQDQKIAGLIADLAKGLGRRPLLAEVRAVAAQRRIQLPVGLSDARPYDLRHSFASVGAGGGLSLQIIGRLLGHTQARTTMRYAHLADDPLREAAEKITRQIAGAGKPKAQVVTLPKRGGAA